MAANGQSMQDGIVSDTPTIDSESHEVPPVTFEWNGATVTCTNLTYSIRGKKRKVFSLINGVSLFLRPGEMTAVLGPSGCGKTTLLDCLAGRKTTGNIDPLSRIHYDGKTVSRDYLRRFVGYVEQQDTLLSMMTPFEMLLYTAELKYSWHTPLADKKAKVATLIDQLGLGVCQHTVIGGIARRGISGGEAKRVNIGLSLITNPKVLFIDELTSGLDSFTGHEVVTVVKNLASAGITTCVSIHSPPPYTFELFDRVVVLQRGRMVYFGPNGDGAADFFCTAFPSLRSMRRSEGVADYLLDVTTSVNYDPEKAAVFADGYAASKQCADNLLEIAEIDEAVNKGTGNGDKAGSHHSRRSRRGDVETGMEGVTEHSSPPSTVKSVIDIRSTRKFTGSTVTPTWWALLVLWRYRSLKAYRMPTFIAPRTGDKLMIVFLVVTLWWQKGDDKVAVTGILFLWSMLSAFTSMGILPTIVIERPVYRRERDDGLYTPATYTFYKITEEILPQIPAGLIYSALVFYIVDLGGSFLLFWLVYLVSTANSIASTFLISSLSSNTSVAGAFMSSYATTLFFFSGYLIPYETIPVYWQWYAVIDFLRYSFGAMMANQFSGSASATSTSNGTGTGWDPLKFYNLEGVDKWTWLGYQAIFFPVFVTLLWAALRWMQHMKR